MTDEEAMEKSKDERIKSLEAKNLELEMSMREHRVQVRMAETDRINALAELANRQKLVDRLLTIMERSGPPIIIRGSSIE